MITETNSRWLRLVKARERSGEGYDVRSLNGEKATIFVVEDDPAMRELLKQMLEPLDAEVEEYATAEAFLTAGADRRDGCLLLDLRLRGGMDGLALYNRLRGQGAVLPVVFLTGYADVATARQVLMSGADFLQKPVDKATLLESVSSAFAQGQRARESQRIAAGLENLTEREWEVMRLVVAGKPNKVICSELGIAQKTVEAHRARVMSKTQAGSVADLVRMFSAFQQDKRAS